MEKKKGNDDVRKALEKAQELIKKKKFDDARSILITLDHPTADKWLARLNEMAPASQTTVVVKEKKPGCIRNIASAIGGLFLCVIVLAVASSMSDSPGGSSSDSDANANSRANPHPAGAAHEIRDGRLQVNGIELDQSDEVHDMNMFNSEPAAGQEWVLVDATFYCDKGADQVCNTTLMQLELVGDAGKAYNREIFAVIEPAFGAEVFGGGQASGVMGFIVDSSDSNFMLVVNEFGRRTFFAIP